jgi:hypothetical protein
MPISHPVAAEHSLRLAYTAALFSLLAAALYALAEVEPLPAVDLFLSAGPLIAVIFWLQRDARRTGIGAVHDLGYFLLLAWPVVIPWYAWKTRRWSGCLLILELFMLIGAAYLGGMLVSLLKT